MKRHHSTGPIEQPKTPVKSLMMLAAILCLSLPCWTIQSASTAGHDKTGSGELLFRGASDASAAVAIDDGHFVVADDENNLLRVYAYEDRSLPLAMADLGAFLQSDPKHPEADIEGVARVGDRIYWITSHGRNKDGKPRPGRCRFFATQIRVDGDRMTLLPSGQAAHFLLLDMLRSPELKGFGLEEAAGTGLKLKKKEMDRLAPKEEGLNIEALAASPDGQRLYIGFRNPQPLLPGQKRPGALVVPLENPAEVIDQGAPAKFGTPLLWDLGGLALRSLDYSAAHRCYYVIAGPHGTASEFELYRWSGQREEPPVFVRSLFPGRQDFTPEALFAPEGEKRLFVLSDDGSLEIAIDDPSQCLPGEMTGEGKCLNKHLADETMKTFKGAWIDTETKQEETGEK